jgi:membrane protease YdiL (CAAX protease family)
MEHAELQSQPMTGVIGTVSIYFLSQIIAGFLILSWPASRGWTGEAIDLWLESSTMAQFFLVLVIEGLSVFMVYQLLRLRGVTAKSIGLIRLRAMDFARALAGFAVYFPLYIGAYSLMQQLLPTIDYDQPQQLGFENVAGVTELALVFFSLVILPPIAEEILCRGLLFSGLRSRFRFVPTAIITSVIFGAAHLQAGSGAPLLWTAALDTFILSMVLCYLRERSGSVWPGIVLHAMKNGLAYVVLFTLR